MTDAGRRMRRRRGPRARRTLRLRDIAAEAVLLAGGARAILLQIAHPAIGAGVARHSAFADDPLARLRGTMSYVYAVVYGTEADIGEVRRRVNRAHRPVHGTDPYYTAFDPELQLWVAATLYDTTVRVHERIFGPLDEASADRIYRDFAAIGTSLQLPEDAWPRDRPAFEAYFDGMLSELEVTREARRTARALLRPSAVPRWLALLMPLVSLVTAGLLPSALRAAYGLRWTPRLSLRYERWMRVVGLLYPRLPAALRRTLAARYVRALRGSRSATS